MTGPAALSVVVGLSAVVAGWPVPSYGQPVATSVGERPVPHDEARQAPHAPVTDKSGTQQPLLTSTGLTIDDPADHGSGPPPSQDPAMPPITDADRAAAFPDVDVATLHDDSVNGLVRVDQLEWRSGETDAVDVDVTGWIGGDRDRLWFRAEGQAEDGELGDAEAHLFYGRAFARWWDVVVGLRQDVRPGPAQTWLALGVQGLAPYWFEVEATGYLGANGQTAARLEAEYELLFTNRLVLQPLVELNLYGKTITERGIGAGVSAFDAGLRIRYEIRREFAPYLGVVWTRAFGDTAAFARAAGETTGGRRFVAGLRLWY